MCDPILAISHQIAPAARQSSHQSRCSGPCRVHTWSYTPPGGPRAGGSLGSSPARGFWTLCWAWSALLGLLGLVGGTLTFYWWFPPPLCWSHLLSGDREICRNHLFQSAKRSFCKRDILLRCKFVCYPFEVLKVFIQLSPLCPANLLTDHLKTQQPEQLAALSLTASCIVKIWSYDTHADRVHHMMHSSDGKEFKWDLSPLSVAITCFNSTFVQNALWLVKKKLHKQY